MSAAANVRTEEQARTVLRAAGFPEQRAGTCRQVTRRNHRCWVFHAGPGAPSTYLPNGDIPVLVADTSAVKPMVAGATVDDILDDLGC